MEKASKALRRSGVRIKSIGSGHSDLQMVISQLKDVRQEEIHRAVFVNSVSDPDSGVFRIQGLKKILIC